MAGMAAGILRAALLIWSSLTFLPAWLITIRGFFEGDAYAWSVSSRINGRGTGGTYFVAPLAATYGLILLALGWSGARRPFHLMLAGWHCPLSIAATIVARRNREALRVEGNTLGIDFSLADVAPIMLGAVTVGTATLAALEQHLGAACRHSKPNRHLLGLAEALIPAQFLLLRAGQQNGLTDKLGVLLTIGQWTGINLALALREGTRRS